jgi:hypothetical protein
MSSKLVSLCKIHVGQEDIRVITSAKCLVQHTVYMYLDGVSDVNTLEGLQACRPMSGEEEHQAWAVTDYGGTSQLQARTSQAKPSKVRACGQYLQNHDLILSDGLQHQAGLGWR